MGQGQGSPDRQTNPLTPFQVMLNIVFRLSYLWNFRLCHPILRLASWFSPWQSSKGEWNDTSNECVLSCKSPGWPWSVTQGEKQGTLQVLRTPLNWQQKLRLLNLLYFIIIFFINSKFCAILANTGLVPTFLKIKFCLIIVCTVSMFDFMLSLGVNISTHCIELFRVTEFFSNLIILCSS